MKVYLNKDGYDILYTESFLTGACSLTINEVNLNKTSKKTFTMEKADGSEALITVKGNYLTGVKLFGLNSVIEVVPAITWYEILIAILCFVLIITLGNIKGLGIPVVGGAIGGGISGALAIIDLFVMKLTNKPFKKICIGLSGVLLTFAICLLVGYLILLMM